MSRDDSRFFSTKGEKMYHNPKYAELLIKSDYWDIRTRLFGKLYALLGPDAKWMLRDLLCNESCDLFLKTNKLSWCTTLNPTDAPWLFVVWCSIKDLPFASGVFWCVSKFMLAKHYGKAKKKKKNVMKWVWMACLCVSHILSRCPFCCNGSHHCKCHAQISIRAEGRLCFGLKK